jgi:hypothetical protein
LKERAKRDAVTDNIHYRICSRHAEGALFRDKSLITRKGLNKHTRIITESNAFQCLGLLNRRFLKDELRINEDDVIFSLAWL